MSMRFILLAGIVLAAPAVAQQPSPPPERVIQVSGTGVVSTAPDVATLEFWLRGEGATADAATQALAGKQKAVVGGLGQLLGRGAEVTTGTVTILEVRGPGCEDARYGGRPRLSEGPCAVVGYLATTQGGARTMSIDRAATAVGLASRLGASDVRLQGFTLSDASDANRRATAAALVDAQARAQAIASGANIRLGAIVSVRDLQYGGGESRPRITQDSASSSPPPPPAPPPPVPLDTRPRPIETRAQVIVTYAIDP